MGEKIYLPQPMILIVQSSFPDTIFYFRIFHESKSIHENVRIVFQSGTTSLSSLTVIEACQRVYH